jgi:HPt (histidine-containing phosphotransfer) domain-containing protein
MSDARTDDVLDERMVTALRGFGREPGRLLHQMATDFLVEAPSLVSEIERAVERHAHAIAARAAHQLKGVSGHIGAVRLAVAAGEVESSARSGEVQAMTAATAAARTELDLAIDAAGGLLE